MTDAHEGALTGYRVLDLTDNRGAYCGRLLADLGAEVIKIERPEGDPSRLMPPFVHDVLHRENSLRFLFKNANKYGITLNLENPDDKAAFKRLVKGSDVLIESFGPGHMEKLGLDFKSLNALNPGLIMAGISEFGRTGPYRDWKGSDIVNFALSGCMILSGFPEKTPCNLPGSPTYDAASLVAGVAILIALYSRGVTGQGQYIDTSVWESAWTGIYAWTFASIHYDPPRPEMRIGAMAYPVYPCKDGYIRVLAVTPRQWACLVRILGNPEVLLMPEWQDMVYRIAYADDLRALMIEFTMDHTMAELFEAGHQEGIPISPVYTVADFVQSPQTKAREFFVELNHPSAGKLACPGPPYKWSVTPCRLTRPAPCLGQHNDDILKKGADHSRPVFSSNQVDQIRGENAITKNAPLNGIRVLSFGSAVVVPDMAKILAEFGADVIKIESLQNLDVMRTLGEQGPDSSSTFNEANRNKRSLGLNLRSEKGRKIAERLISLSDIVAENFRGGALKKLGLDYENAREINPNIIYFSCSGFGIGGPWSQYQAYGPLLVATSGLVHLWAHPDDPYPVGSHIAYPDHMASKQAAIAVLAALDYRRRTGKGQFIDMALIEVGANLIGDICLDYTINNRVQKPIGNRSPYAAPHGCYRCKGDDRWCAIAVFTEEEWKKFCKAIGSPEWTERNEFKDIQSRLNYIDTLDRLVEAWTIEHEAYDIMETLQNAGVRAGVVMHAYDTVSDPHLDARGAIVEVDHPVTEKKPYPASPFRLSDIPPLKSTPAPVFGQHTDEICRDLLNMTADEVLALKQEGVLEGPKF